VAIANKKYLKQRRQVRIIRVAVDVLVAAASSHCRLTYIHGESCSHSCVLPGTKLYWSCDYCAQSAHLICSAKYSLSLSESIQHYDKMIMSRQLIPSQSQCFSCRKVYSWAFIVHSIDNKALNKKRKLVDDTRVPRHSSDFHSPENVTDNNNHNEIEDDYPYEKPNSQLSESVSSDSCRTATEIYDLTQASEDEDYFIHSDQSVQNCPLVCYDDYHPSVTKTNNSSHASQARSSPLERITISTDIDSTYGCNLAPVIRLDEDAFDPLSDDD
jgi:hypothetical protein